MATATHSFTEKIKGSLLVGQNIRQSNLENTFAATNKALPVRRLQLQFHRRDLPFPNKE
jgi:hypothetical protein